MIYSCRSPQQSAEIFRSLMINHEEVDVQKAVSVGNLSQQSGEGFGQVEGEGSGENRDYYRYAAQEILLSLPGVNNMNYRNVLHHSKVKSLSDLSLLSEAELVSLLGPVNAKKLFAFLHHKQ